MTIRDGIIFLVSKCLSHACMIFFIALMILTLLIYLFFFPFPLCNYFHFFFYFYFSLSSVWCMLPLLLLVNHLCVLHTSQPTTAGQPMAAQKPFWLSSNFYLVGVAGQNLPSASFVFCCIYSFIMSEIYFLYFTHQM